MIDGDVLSGYDMLLFVCVLALIRCLVVFWVCLFVLLRDERNDRSPLGYKFCVVFQVLAFLCVLALFRFIWYMFLIEFLFLFFNVFVSFVWNLFRCDN